ncbi:MAG: AAA family ATPase [bacterium]
MRVERKAVAYTPPNEEPDEGTFEIVKKLNGLIEFISHQIVGREEIIRQSFYALLTGEHQLLFSRTGMAKSLQARQIFNCFEQVTVFEKQLTKDTMPDNLFGAYDIVQLKRGKLVHNVDGSIVLADFAFLDEVFDANDMLLRSLLSLLNEKRFMNGGEQISSPLNTVIATANYVRVTEVLEAVLDRFLYKSFIPENKNLYLQMLIDYVFRENHGRVVDPQVKINLEELCALKNIINSQRIEIPDYILFLKNYIVRRYIEEVRSTDPERPDFIIGDRTSVKIQNLLRASAILDYRTAVEEKDLEQMYYLICMLGKNNEKERLSTIVETARKYFGDDKEVLEDILPISRLVWEMKRSRGEDDPLKSARMISAMEGIEDALKDKGNRRGFRKKLADMMPKRVITLPHKSEMERIVSMVRQYCTTLKNIAAKKETIELISGLEEDLDNFRLRPQ